MGSVHEIKCDNCTFSVQSWGNYTMIVCNEELDYYNMLYCLNCQKIVKVWQRKNDKDTINKCPECGSNQVFLEIPNEIKVKCPKCKKGNLKSELFILTD